MNTIPSDNQLGPAEPGKIISHYGSSVAVEDAHGKSYRCFFRQALKLVVGDDVLWSQTHGDEGVVTSILPRRTILSRFGKDGREQVMAANIDNVVVMLSASLPCVPLDIDRYLLATELSNMQAVLVVNKIDLLDEAQLAYWQSALQLYTDLGYPVYFTNVFDKKSLRVLIDTLQRGSSIIIGQSGVGKSSLIKTLLPEASIRVGEVAQGSHLGKHTTTGAYLYHLPTGGDLIDSAGIRHFSGWLSHHHDLIDGFREFLPYLGHCKFRNCEHKKEPACALKEAVESGEIDANRLENYHTIMSEFAQ